MAKTPKKVGRPKLEIDWATVEKLCSILCTGQEIADILGIHYDTLAVEIKAKYEMSFPEYLKKHGSKGRASLRRAQYKLAVEKENPTMLIWLGKQHLDQKERTDVSSEDGTMTPRGFNDFYSKSDS